MNEFCLIKINRDLEDIYIDMDNNIGYEETYKNILIEINFSCQCYDIDDAICGEKFYLSQKDKTFTNSYVYYSQKSALEKAKEIIDYFQNNNKELEERF